MDNHSLRTLKLKIFFIFPLAFLLLAAILMLTAGTLRYWHGWVYCGLIMLFAFYVTSYFLKRSPDFLMRRMSFKEKETEQKTLVKLSNMFFLAGILISGLDFRFGWSDVPIWLVFAADLIVLVGYYVIFLSFKENAYAGRTVEVFSGQKVIDTGLYALVRHPMYMGIIPLFTVTPLALGSYWGLIPLLFVGVIIVLRTVNEEKILRAGLAGYKEYCTRVRYRLIPFIW